MYFKQFLVASGVLLMTSFAASATVIDFDNPPATDGNPGDPYTVDGYTFQPAGGTGDTKCWNGKCLKEVTQGTTTTLTYDAPPGDGSNDPFELDYFYFDLIGNTTTSNDSYSLTGYFDNGDIITAEFILGDPVGTIYGTFYDASLLTTTTSIVMGYTTFAEHHGMPHDHSILNFNDGYWMDLNENWTGLASVTWFTNTATGVQDGQFRLDCVAVGGEGPSSQTTCLPSEVPVPAAAWLLLAGLGGLGGMAGLRRRNKAA